MEKQISALDAQWLPQALDLVWETFSSQIAPLCTADGIDDFWSAIDYEYLLHQIGDGVIRMWGALDGERLIGVCAVRELCHIQLLFVAQEEQYQGAGTILLKKALIDCKQLNPQIHRVTVNAMGDSDSFFTRLGFLPCGAAEEDGGIPCTPMEISA